MSDRASTVWRRRRIARAALAVATSTALLVCSGDETQKTEILLTISSTLDVDTVKLRARKRDYTSDLVTISVADRNLVEEPLVFIVEPTAIATAAPDGFLLLAIGVIAGDEVVSAAQLVAFVDGTQVSVELKMNEKHYSQDADHDGFVSCAASSTDGCDCRDQDDRANVFTDENCSTAVDENCAGYPPNDGCSGCTSDEPCTGLPSELWHLAGLGACALGTAACSNGVLGSCVGWGEPATEACNDQIDNDCDGHVDEGCSCTNGTARVCYMGLVGAAATGAVQGVCKAGTQTCIDGVWVNCSGETRPEPRSDGAGFVEVKCDGLDEDCDGLVDEEPGFDGDGDGFTACGTCLAEANTTVAGALVTVSLGSYRLCSVCMADANTTVQLCAETIDCNDANATIHPPDDNETYEDCRTATLDDDCRCDHDDATLAGNAIGLSYNRLDGGTNCSSASARLDCSNTERSDPTRVGVCSDTDDNATPYFAGFDDEGECRGCSFDYGTTCDANTGACRTKATACVDCVEQGVAIDARPLCKVPDATTCTDAIAAAWTPSPGTDAYNDCGTVDCSQVPAYHGISGTPAVCYFKADIDAVCEANASACQSAATACAGAGQGDADTGRPLCTYPASGCSGQTAPVFANVAAGEDPYSDCASGDCDGAGACERQKGQACTASTQCVSGFCVDSYCCDAACTGVCVACSAALTASADGTCASIDQQVVDTLPTDLCTGTTGCTGASCICAASAAACRYADGAACTSNGNCASGQCECADATCSNKVCSAVGCGTCEFDANGDGSCEGVIAAGVDDAEDSCDTETCRGDVAGCYNAAGDGCALPVDCQTNFCECADADCNATICSADDCSCTFTVNGSDNCGGSISNGLDPEGGCGGGLACYSGACAASCAAGGDAACEAAYHCFTGAGGAICESDAKGNLCDVDAECSDGNCECGNALCTSATRRCSDTRCECTYTSDGAGVCDGALTNATDPESLCGYTYCVAGVCDTSCATNDDSQCKLGAHCESNNTCGADHGSGVACDVGGDCVSGYCRTDWDGSGTFCAESSTACVLDGDTNGAAETQVPTGNEQCSGAGADAWRSCANGVWGSATSCDEGTCNGGCGYFSDANNTCVNGSAGGCKANIDMANVTCVDCGDFNATAGACNTGAIANCDRTCGAVCQSGESNDTGVDACSGGDPEGNSTNVIAGCVVSGGTCQWSDAAASDTLNQDCGNYACSVGNGACFATCDSNDSRCDSAAHCDSDNTCGTDHGSGVACDVGGDCVSGYCRTDWDGVGTFCADSNSSCVLDGDANGVAETQSPDGNETCAGDADTWRSCASGSWGGATSCDAGVCAGGCGYYNDANNTCGSGAAGGCKADIDMPSVTCVDCGDFNATAGACQTSAVANCDRTCGAVCQSGDTNDTGVDACSGGVPEGNSTNVIAGCVVGGGTCQWSDAAAVDTLNQNCGNYACSVGSGACFATCDNNDSRCDAVAHCEDDNVTCNADHGVGTACSASGDCTGGECECAEGNCTTKICSVACGECKFTMDLGVSCDGNITLGFDNADDTCGYRVCNGAGNCFANCNDNNDSMCASSGHCDDNGTSDSCAADHPAPLACEGAQDCVSGTCTLNFCVP